MSGYTPNPRSGLVSGDTEPSVVRSVAVVDDHMMLAETLVDVLERYGVEARAIEATSREAILDDLKSNLPDVAIFDLHLGDDVGRSTEFIPEVVEMGVPVLVVTADAGSLVVAECLEAGAAGVLYKGMPAGAVLEGVSKAAAGNSMVSEAERQDLIASLREDRRRRRRRLASFDDLTVREAEVLVMICDGLSAAEIADESYVSVATVRSQIRSILMKLGVRSQLAAAAKARQSGWLADQLAENRASAAGAL
jgi:DNA-binding NarL/FixJ family response regulator